MKKLSFALFAFPLLFMLTLATFVSGQSVEVRPKVVDVLTINTTSACTAANLTETDLWTYSLPANTLTANNTGIRVRAFGINGATANVKNYRIYFGANVMVARSSSGNATGWDLEVVVLRTGASAELFYGVSDTGVGGTSTIAPSTLAESLAAAVTIKVTGQNGTGVANDVCFKGAVVEILR
jgi:hypothetical protein